MATIPGVPHPDELREQLNTTAGWLERYKSWTLDGPAELEATLLGEGFRKGGSLNGAARTAEQLHAQFKRLYDATEAAYYASQGLYSALSDAKREHERRMR
jgi:hypothetical protein